MRSLIATCLLVLAAPAGLAQESGELQSGIKAEVRFVDAAGLSVDKVKAGARFDIAVALTDATTGGPAVLSDELFGWIRPVEESNSKCAEAGRSFRATGRLPSSAISLNGILLVALSHDGSLTVVDPKLDLATSNILAASKLDEGPGGVIIHPVTRQIYFTLPKRGELLSLSPADGAVKTVLAGLEAPAELAWTPEGVLVLDRGKGQAVRVSIDGATVDRVALPDAGMQLVDNGGDMLALWDSAGHVLALDRADGLKRFTFDAGPLRAVAVHGARHGETMATLGREGEKMTLRFLEAPDEASTIELAAEAARLAFSPDGRFVFAYDPGSNIVSIVDVASGKLIQAVSLEVDEGGISVRDIGFAGKTALLLSGDGNFIFKLPLSSVKFGKAPELTKVRLGAGAPPLPLDGTELIASLAPSPQALVVHPGSYTAFVIDDQPASFNTPPMTGVRLRGGFPTKLRVIDRSFAVTEPGSYRNSAVLPRNGDYELVISTGLSGMTACIKLSAYGGEMAVTPRKLVIRSAQADWRPRAAVEERVSLMLSDGKASWPLPRARLRVSGLTFNWRTLLDMPTGMSAALRFPRPGHYVLEVVGLDPKQGVVAPLQVEVAP